MVPYSKRYSTARASMEKWSEDPRNTQWSNDTKKFGYRMLQRMGWEKGRGLGALEDGTTEHVRVSMRKDNSGLGSKKGRDDGWIEHQDAFEDILTQLNKQQGSATGGGDRPQARALVDTATSCRRLVYSKFLRSKDLSTASPRDLDCVLGRKRRSEDSPRAGLQDSGSVPDSKRIKPTPEPQQSLQNTDAPVTIHGITTVTRTQSVHDYFSTKMGHRSSEHIAKRKKKKRT